MKLITILVRHGTTDYADAEPRLAAILARQLPDVHRDLVVVDNALPPETVVPVTGHTLLGADNHHREFGAFDRAIDWLGSRIQEYDYVQFATSAFEVLYTAYIERFTTNVLRARGHGPVAVGHIDCYNDPVRLGPYVSQHWIRTCFFFVRPATVKAIGSLVSVADGKPYFTGDPAAPFRADAPLSDNYRRYIIDWLTGSDIGQGVTWHSKLPLTAESLPSFELKTLSILNEHMLAIRLRALGCPVVDVTWLSAMMARAPEASIEWRTPWQDQLANRDRDRIVVPVHAAP